MKRSVNGRNIIDIITKVQENKDVLSQLTSHLEPLCIMRFSNRQLQLKKKTHERDTEAITIPSDDFFLFMRECETCLRRNVNKCEISKDSFINAKEIIMEDHMVSSTQNNF
ncbi:hypothetical protein DPMN_127222 [Dreissena polymorpha]|uniref:Uncharacterized protein n=1 Tax=Dreissena polymorpha TaxID=45954 RepID=A0A9D4H4U4_DREPO|nr:hypothetical protein DPMN_127222 [Dreissena polymorpha]